MAIVFTVIEVRYLLMIINEYLVMRSGWILYTTKYQRDLRKHKKTKHDEECKL
jgi:hypothetical protein